MLIFILGVAKVGKTKISKLLKEKYDFYLIHTDIIRRELGYHRPNQGFYTEIDTNSKHLFYNDLNLLIEKEQIHHKSIIVERNAIDPSDVEIFNPDLVFLLGNGLDCTDKLKLAQKYSEPNAWIYRRDSLYLENLFSFYEKVEAEWISKHQDIYVNMSNFTKGLELIDNKINDLIKKDTVI